MMEMEERDAGWQVGRGGERGDDGAAWKNMKVKGVG